MISRRKFLKRSTEAGVAIATAPTSFGALLFKHPVASAGTEATLPNADARAQRSLEIRCDSARADARRIGSALTTNGDENAMPTKEQTLPRRCLMMS